jgi:hypothetical protein
MTRSVRSSRHVTQAIYGVPNGSSRLSWGRRPGGLTTTSANGQAKLSWRADERRRRPGNELRADTTGRQQPFLAILPIGANPASHWSAWRRPVLAEDLVLYPRTGRTERAVPVHNGSGEVRAVAHVDLSQIGAINAMPEPGPAYRTMDNGHSGHLYFGLSCRRRRGARRGSERRSRWSGPPPG